VLGFEEGRDFALLERGGWDGYGGLLWLGTTYTARN